MAALRVRRGGAPRLSRVTWQVWKPPIAGSRCRAEAGDACLAPEAKAPRVSDVGGQKGSSTQRPLSSAWGSLGFSAAISSAPGGS